MLHKKRRRGCSDLPSRWNHPGVIQLGAAWGVVDLLRGFNYYNNQREQAEDGAESIKYEDKVHGEFRQEEDTKDQYYYNGEKEEEE